MAKKSTGEIGPTLITVAGDGAQTAEVISTILPFDKEELERFFADRFIISFNDLKPLGPEIRIEDAKQLDTSDLDFKLKCAAADYLELAELNPRSEEFGRAAFRTGKLNVYPYARWIYMRVVRKKMLAYGPQLSGRLMLLLYTTHWQFLPNAGVYDCLRSLVKRHGCTFAAVFFLVTDGNDLRFIEQLHPHFGTVPHKPAEYKGRTLTNLAPGQANWTVNTVEHF